MNRRRIAVINQRYGEEVNGGSEYYARMLAEHLARYYDVEVLTTTALDYDTWKPYFKAGAETINGICVRRFDVWHPRRLMYFKVLNRIMNKLPMQLKERWGKYWVEEQGPYCPDLIQYIEEYKDSYDYFIFVTYLYYTTAVGMMICPEKSILVPTAHDEYCIYFPLYQDIFKRPRGIVYLTEAEKEFVEKTFKNQEVPHVVAGSGVEIPENLNTEQALKKYGINGEYIIYVGRVDKGKCCDELFKYFLKYKKENPNGLKLVVAGKVMMDVPQAEDIQYLGFIDEEDKYGLMAGAKALMLPSKYESLSLSVLESLALGVPILVNGACEVLRDHCLKSQAGRAYENYREFAASLKEILTDADKRDKMGQLGKAYVEVNYTWRATIEKYRTLLEG